MVINSRGHVLSLFANAAVKGPVIFSHGFDPELQADVEVMEFEVANKTRIPEDLPFGLLMTVMPGNINKTRMRVRVGPGFYTEEGVAWPQLCRMAHKVTEFIATATVCTKVVPPDFDLNSLSPHLLWEADLRPVDPRHSLLTTVYVNERNSITVDENDEILGGTLRSVKNLYYSAEPLFVTVAGTLTPVATGELKKVEDLNGFPQLSTAVDGSTYPATRAYYSGTAWVLSRHTGASLVPYGIWTSADCTLEDCPSPALASGWTPTLGVGMSTPTGTPTFTDQTAAEIASDDTHVYWELKADFTVNECKQLSKNWWVFSNKQVVSDQMKEDGRTYNSAVDFFWPAVLSSVQVDTWNRNEGGTDMYARPVMLREAYRGPCKATFVEEFFLDAPAATALTAMQPLPIDVVTPFFGVNIAPTLHALTTITVSTGTDHPVYTYTGGSFVFAATNYTDWPTSILASSEVRPLRGGYLRTTVTVFKPNT